ncbi:undecaprenyldiphospho-muramoylpentapeptide beta-N-acetylglucosaminyltransferase [bacterium]|nr:undecaprenyldiphospho-muramoylpentapeptide beta-N-acetylglucosaminyltransferase [bacterium]
MVESSDKIPTLILGGGGTGGHVAAGVALADEWKKRFQNGRVVFVGSQGGMEEKIVPRAGYPLHVLTLGSLNRVSLARKLKTLIQLPLSFWISGRILMREHPCTVIGVGGYSSGPVVLMARLLQPFLRARIAIIEQNAVPGFTNRALSWFAQRIFVAFPGLESQFPAKKVLFTGNPIRSAMKPLPSAPRDPFTIFLFGGSQGAAGINTLMLEALPHLKSIQGKLKIIHQTGEKDFERVKAGYASAGVPARVEVFIHDIVDCYSAASLLVCRAGSSTLSEIAAVGRAAILIPFPFAADNHQEKNARKFEEAGAAKVLVQSHSKGEDLAREILEFYRHPERLNPLEKAAQAFYRPNAARDVIQNCLET